MIAASLRGCGIEVIAVRSAMEGLDALAGARPDVIVGDIGMPERDGYWSIRQVRAGETEMAATPATAPTAYARQSDTAQALDAGFQVTKPVEFERLLAAIPRLAAGDTEA